MIKKVKAVLCFLMLSAMVKGQMLQAYKTSTTVGNQNWTGTLGLTFNVTKPIQIKQLGVFDQNGDGIKSAGIRVAIFDNTMAIYKTLDATVTGTEGTLSAGYRFKDVAPVTLPVGTYTIVTQGYGNAEQDGNYVNQTTGDLNNGTIVYVNSRYGLTWGFPNVSDNVPVKYLAGSFRYTTDSVVATTTPAAGGIIVCDGNSLTAGGETQPYPHWLGLKAPYSTDGTKIYNFGIGGQTTQMMAGDAAFQIDPLYSTTNSSNILIAYEIGNDIYFYGSVDNAENNFKAYCLARKAVGWKVYVITMTPRDQVSGFGDNSATFNAKIAQANAWLKSNYKTFADGIVDAAAEPRFANPHNLVYYVPDAVHYSDSGHQVLATLVYNALNAPATPPLQPVLSLPVSPVISTDTAVVFDNPFGNLDTLRRDIYIKKKGDTTNSFTIYKIKGYDLFQNYAGKSYPCNTPMPTKIDAQIFLKEDKTRIDMTIYDVMFYEVPK